MFCNVVLYSEEEEENDHFWRWAAIDRRGYGRSPSFFVENSEIQLNRVRQHQENENKYNFVNTQFDENEIEVF